MVEDLLAPGGTDDEPLPPPRPTVAFWTLEDLRPLADEDAAAGDAKRGAAVFRDALCSRCHRAGATGPAVGPDLTYVARRFDRGDMLEAIVEPSRSVAENYRNVSIVTDSGRVLVGRLTMMGDFRAEKLRLNVDPLRPGQAVEIDKREVEEQRLVDTSPMPQGLLNGFTREEIADLLAFLEDEFESRSNSWRPRTLWARDKRRRGRFTRPDLSRSRRTRDRHKSETNCHSPAWL